MGDAFDKARKLLHDRGQPGVVQEIIAKRIIDVARTGERNADRMCKQVLGGSRHRPCGTSSARHRT